VYQHQEQDKCNIAKSSALKCHNCHRPTAFDIEEIIDNFDRKLFSKITHSGHCLHHLLPPKTSEQCSYSLRKRKHYYQLPNVEFALYKNCFINRCLFKFRWYSVCFVLFLMFYVFYSFLSSFTFHCNSVRLTYCIKGYLTGSHVVYVLALDVM